MNKKLDLVEAVLDLVVLAATILLCIYHFTAVVVFCVGFLTMTFGISLVSAVIKLFRKQE